MGGFPSVFHGSTPKPDLLTSRNAAVAATRKAASKTVAQETTQDNNVQGADQGTSDGSSSSEMPELVAIENEEREDVVDKPSESISRRPSGSTVCEKGEMAQQEWIKWREI